MVEWECKFCHFLNSGRGRRCTMCESFQTQEKPTGFDTHYADELLSVNKKAGSRREASSKAKVNKSKKAAPKKLTDPRQNSSSRQSQSSSSDNDGNNSDSDTSDDDDQSKSESSNSDAPTHSRKKKSITQSKPKAAPNPRPSIAPKVPAKRVSRVSFQDDVNNPPAGQNKATKSRKMADSSSSDESDKHDSDAPLAKKRGRPPTVKRQSVLSPASAEAKRASLIAAKLVSRSSSDSNDDDHGDFSPSLVNAKPDQKNSSKPKSNKVQNINNINNISNNLDDENHANLFDLDSAQNQKITKRQKTSTITAINQDTVQLSALSPQVLEAEIQAHYKLTPLSTLLLKYRQFNPHLYTSHERYAYFNNQRLFPLLAKFGPTCLPLLASSFLSMLNPLNPDHTQPLSSDSHFDGIDASPYYLVQELTVAMTKNEGKDKKTASKAKKSIAHDNVSISSLLADLDNQLYNPSLSTSTISPSPLEIENNIVTLEMDTVYKQLVEYNASFNTTIKKYVQMMDESKPLFDSPLSHPRLPVAVLRKAFFDFNPHFQKNLEADPASISTQPEPPFNGVSVLKTKFKELFPIYEKIHNLMQTNAPNNRDKDPESVAKAKNELRTLYSTFYRDLNPSRAVFITHSDLESRPIDRYDERTGLINLINPLLIPQLRYPPQLYDILYQDLYRGIIDGSFQWSRSMVTSSVSQPKYSLEYVQDLCENFDNIFSQKKDFDDTMVSTSLIKREKNPDGAPIESDLSGLDHERYKKIKEDSDVAQSIIDWYGQHKVDYRDPQQRRNHPISDYYAQIESLHQVTVYPPEPNVYTTKIVACAIMTRADPYTLDLIMDDANPSSFYEQLVEPVFLQYSLEQWIDMVKQFPPLSYTEAVVFRIIHTHAETLELIEHLAPYLAAKNIHYVPYGYSPQDSAFYISAKEENPYDMENIDRSLPGHKKRASTLIVPPQVGVLQTPMDAAITHIFSDNPRHTDKIMFGSASNADLLLVDWLLMSILYGRKLPYSFSRTSIIKHPRDFMQHYMYRVIDHYYHRAKNGNVQFLEGSSHHEITDDILDELGRLYQNGEYINNENSLMLLRQNLVPGVGEGDLFVVDHTIFSQPELIFTRFFTDQKHSTVHNFYKQVRDACFQQDFNFRLFDPVMTSILTGTTKQNTVDQSSARLKVHIAMAIKSHFCTALQQSLLHSPLPQFPASPSPLSGMIFYIIPSSLYNPATFTINTIPQFIQQAGGIVLSPADFVEAFLFGVQMHHNAPISHENEIKSIDLNGNNMDDDDYNSDQEMDHPLSLRKSHLLISKYDGVHQFPHLVHYINNSYNSHQYRENFIQNILPLESFDIPMEFPKGDEQHSSNRVQLSYPLLLKKFSYMWEYFYDKFNITRSQFAPTTPMMPTPILNDTKNSFHSDYGYKRFTPLTAIPKKNDKNTANISIIPSLKTHLESTYKTLFVPSKLHKPETADPFNFSYASSSLFHKSSLENNSVSAEDKTQYASWVNESKMDLLDSNVTVPRQFLSPSPSTEITQALFDQVFFDPANYFPITIIAPRNSQQPKKDKAKESGLNEVENNITDPLTVHAIQHHTDTMLLPYAIAHRVTICHNVVKLYKRYFGLSKYKQHCPAFISMLAETSPETAGSSLQCMNDYRAALKEYVAHIATFSACFPVLRLNLLFDLVTRGKSTYFKKDNSYIDTYKQYLIYAEKCIKMEEADFIRSPLEVFENNPCPVKFPIPIINGKHVASKMMVDQCFDGLVYSNAPNLEDRAKILQTYQTVIKKYE